MTLTTEEWRRRIGRPSLQGNPGSETQNRGGRPATYESWTGDVLRTDRLGGILWQRLRRLRHAPEEENSLEYTGLKF